MKEEGQMNGGIRKLGEDMETSYITYQRVSRRNVGEQFMRKKRIHENFKENKMIWMEINNIREGEEKMNQLLNQDDMGAKLN